MCNLHILYIQNDAQLRVYDLIICNNYELFIMHCASNDMFTDDTRVYLLVIKSMYTIFIVANRFHVYVYKFDPST